MIDNLKPCDICVDTLYSDVEVYFYIHNIDKDGNILSSGVSKDGIIFPKSYHFYFDRKASLNEISNFVDILRRFNLILDINRGIIRNDNTI